MGKNVAANAIVVTPEMMGAAISVLDWWDSDECEEWDRRVLALKLYEAMEINRCHTPIEKTTDNQKD